MRIAIGIGKRDYVRQRPNAKYLQCCVPVPEGGCVWLLEAVEVYADSERDGDLVRAGVTTADRAGGVVNAVGYLSLGQRLGQLLLKDGRKRYIQIQIYFLKKCSKKCGKYLR